MPRPTCCPIEMKESKSPTYGTILGFGIGMILAGTGQLKNTPEAAQVLIVISLTLAGNALGWGLDICRYRFFKRQNPVTAVNPEPLLTNTGSTSALTGSYSSPA